MNYLSVNQFAQATNKTRQWVWMLIKAKRIQAFKVGNNYIIPRVELNKVIDEKIANTS